MCKDSALSWYEEYCTRVKPKERNYHTFILELRKKVVPSTAGLELWKEWEEYRHDKLTTKHEPNPPVNLHSLECLKYYNSCIDPKGEKMINQHVLKVKFVIILLEHIRRPTRMLIDYNMDYEKIVETAERMLAENSKNNPARAITERGTTYHYDSQGRKIRQKTPEDRGRSPGFMKSAWRKGDPAGSGGSAPGRSQPKKKTYPPRPTTRNTGYTKPKPKTRNRTFRQMSDKEKESLKAQNKSLICKQVGHYTRDCPNKGSVSTVYQQVSYNKKPWQQRTPFQGSRPWPSTAVLDIMRLPSDDRKYLIPQTAKVSCAVLVQINTRDAQVLLEPCTQHRNLISNQFCDTYNLSGTMGVCHRGIRRPERPKCKLTVEDATLLFWGVMTPTSDLGAIFGRPALVFHAVSMPRAPWVPRASFAKVWHLGACR